MHRSPLALTVLALALLATACSSDDGPTTPDRRYHVFYEVTSDQPIGFLEYDPGNAFMEARTPNVTRWELDLFMTPGDTAMIRASSFQQGATIVVRAMAESSDMAGNDFDTSDTCTDLCTATVGPIELD